MKTEVGTTFSEPMLTYTQYSKKIKELDFHSSLMKLQNFSALMGNQAGVNINLEFEFHHSPKMAHRVLVTRQSLSFICKEIILNCKKSKQELTDLELIQLVNKYENLITDLNTVNGSDEKGRLWVLRATNLQHYYLRHPVMIIGRYYYIFKILIERDGDFAEKLNKKLKLNILDIFRIGFCVWTVLNLNKFFSKKNLLNGNVPYLKPLLTENNVNNFLKLFSITQNGFIKETKKFSINNELLKKYEFNPLKRFPIIKTNSKDERQQYVIPSLGDFMYGFSEGLYYVLLDKLDESQRATLLAMIGNIFEEYIGNILKYYNIDLLSRAQLFPEQEYFRDKKHKIKSADWLLVSDEYIYQIECKKRKNDIYLKAGIDAESGKNGVNKTFTDIAKELDKLIQKRNDIKENKVEILKYKNQKIINVIVYLDEMFSIDNFARSDITEKMKIKDDDFYILGCHEFEILCQMCRNNNSSLYQNILLLINNNVEIYKIDFLQEEFEIFNLTLKRQRK